MAHRAMIRDCGQRLRTFKLSYCTVILLDKVQGEAIYGLCVSVSNKERALLQLHIRTAQCRRNWSGAPSADIDTDSLLTYSTQVYDVVPVSLQQHLQIFLLFCFNFVPLAKNGFIIPDICALSKPWKKERKKKKKESKLLSTGGVKLT